MLCYAILCHWRLLGGSGVDQETELAHVMWSLLCTFFPAHMLVTNVHYLNGVKLKSNAILLAHARSATLHRHRT